MSVSKADNCSRYSIKSIAQSFAALQSQSQSPNLFRCASISIAHVCPGACALFLLARPDGRENKYVWNTVLYCLMLSCSTLSSRFVRARTGGIFWRVIPGTINTVVVRGIVYNTSNRSPHIFAASISIAIAPCSWCSRFSLLAEPVWRKRNKQNTKVSCFVS